MKPSRRLYFILLFWTSSWFYAVAPGPRKLVIFNGPLPSTVSEQYLDITYGVANNYSLKLDPTLTALVPAFKMDFLIAVTPENNSVI